MSIMRCDHCSGLIDTDFDVEAFTVDESGRYGEGPCLCESCRTSYYCKDCGERPANCDDDCHECLAARYISGEESITQDMEVFPDIWTLPGYAKCLELVRAAQQVAA